MPSAEKEGKRFVDSEERTITFYHYYNTGFLIPRLTQSKRLKGNVVNLDPLRRRRRNGDNEMREKDHCGMPGVHTESDYTQGSREVDFTGIQ